MSQNTFLHLYYDPKKHIIKKLKNGNGLIVTNHEDQLLKNGAFGTLNNPVKRGQWYNLLEKMYKTFFDMNAYEMSEVLDELYPSGEYARQKLYENVPSLREKLDSDIKPSERKKIKRFYQKLSPGGRKYLEDIAVKSNFPKQQIEELGEKASEKIYEGRK